MSPPPPCPDHRPRLPGSQTMTDQKNEFFNVFHCCCCETRIKESNMIASGSGLSRSNRTKEFNMCATLSRCSPSLKHRPKSPTREQVSLEWLETRTGVETCVQVSWKSHPSGTDGKERRAVVRLHTLPTFFVVRTKESATCVQKLFTIMLGSMHDGQPTVILRASVMKR